MFGSVAKQVWLRLVKSWWLGEALAPHHWFFYMSSPPALLCVQSALVEMGEGVSQQRAVLLRGEVGVGKTSLVLELAARTGRTRGDVLTLQISDSTDARLLVGLYRYSYI